MKTIISELRGALMSTVMLALVCCALYPLLVCAIGQALFPKQANGSLVTDAQGVIRGSALIGQNFAGEPPESFPRRADRGAGPCWSARLFSNRDIFLSNGGVGRHYDFYRA